MWLTRLASSTGNLGSIIAAMSCAACFPAIAGIGSALGLGFLAQFEGLFINTLLPLFAGLALITQLLVFRKHRRWLRLLAGTAGPLMVLATLYLFWSDTWSTYLFYLGLFLMLCVAVADLRWPATRECQARTSTGSAIQ